MVKSESLLFVFLFYLSLSVGVPSCAPTPQRSLARAQRYFPDIFEPDTVMVNLPPVTTEISCDTIVKYDTVRYALAFADDTHDSVRVEFRTVYKYKDRPVPYQVFKQLSRADSVSVSKAITLTVDCPDSEVTAKKSSRLTGANRWYALITAFFIGLLIPALFLWLPCRWGKRRLKRY